MICMNGRTKNWRLLLLPTRVVRAQVKSQAPSVSNCWSDLKQNLRGAIGAAATAQYRR